MSFRLGGTNPLSYIGVEPLTPPALLVIPRSPTQNDFKNINLGTFWLVAGQSVTQEELWILISVEGGIATWVQLYPNNNAGATQFPADTGVANEAGGILNILGDAVNIFTTGAGNTITIDLGPSIFLPNTTSTGSQGVYYINAIPFLHKFGGTQNAFGGGSGNLTLVSGNNNTGFGFSSLQALTSGTSNQAYGNGALNHLTTGTENIAIGSSSLDSLTTSSDNIAIGFNSLNSLQTGEFNIVIGAFGGTALATAESSNILIGNVGLVGEDSTIRIGTDGVIPSTQNQCFIAGIYNQPVASPNQQVFIDATGKLGTTGGSGAGIPQFLAVLDATDGPYPSDGTTLINLGAGLVMTEITDTQSTFFPGDGAGAPATFTAPADGLYQFNFGCSVELEGGAVTIISMKLVITTNSRTYTLNCLPVQSLDFKSGMLSVCADMSTADTATFGAICITAATNFLFTPGTTAPFENNPVTWVSGFKIG